MTHSNGEGSNDKRELIYLASPYSHPDPMVRYERLLAVCRAAAKLIKQGRVVFCPISHTVPISFHGNLDAMDQDLWGRQDRAILEVATELIVLKLPGLEKSLGVAEEMAIALARGIPVTFMEDED